MLTERKKAFADNFLLTRIATEAAKIAGYSPKTCRSQGSRLLTDVDVKAYIQAEKDKIQARLDERKDALSKDTYVEKLVKDYESVDVDSANRPRFIEMVGKTLGFIGPGGNQVANIVNNTQINIRMDAPQLELWELTRALLGQSPS